MTWVGLCKANIPQLIINKINWGTSDHWRDKKFEIMHFECLIIHLIFKNNLPVKLLRIFDSFIYEGIICNVRNEDNVDYSNDCKNLVFNNLWLSVKITTQNTSDPWNIPLLSWNMDNYLQQKVKHWHTTCFNNNLLLLQDDPFPR